MMISKIVIGPIKCHHYEAGYECKILIRKKGAVNTDLNK
jgi:hypothetical protein